MQKNKKHSSLLLWIVIAILIILGSGAFLWQKFSTSPTPSISKSITAPAPAPAPAIKKIPSKSLEATSLPHTSTTLVDDDLSKQQVPQNAALTQEEIDKLNDIQKQLKAQEHTLQAQHQDADKLIQLKQEQIKLLEKQLSQTQ